MSQKVLPENYVEKVGSAVVSYHDIASDILMKEMAAIKLLLVVFLPLMPLYGGACTWF